MSDDKPICDATDDELLRELATRNRACVYAAVRDVSAKGEPEGPTLMVHGGSFDIQGLSGRLVQFIISRNGS